MRYKVYIKTLFIILLVSAILIFINNWIQYYFYPIGELNFYVLEYGSITIMGLAFIGIFNYFIPFDNLQKIKHTYKIFALIAFLISMYLILLSMDYFIGLILFLFINDASIKWDISFYIDGYNYYIKNYMSYPSYNAHLVKTIIWMLIVCGYFIKKTIFNYTYFKNKE